jgi:hypothetical protein
MEYLVNIEKGDIVDTHNTSNAYAMSKKPVSEC